MIGVLAVAGIGSLHFIESQRPGIAAISGLIALLACVPMVYRQRRLRAGDYRAASWEMLLLTGCCLALAAAVFFART